MRIRAKVDKSTFSRKVFGGDCFVEQFPQLFTAEGVDAVQTKHGYYYILRPDGRRVSDTHFFSWGEFEMCLEEVK